MRVEKLEELKGYINELKAIKKTLVPSDYVYDNMHNPVKRKGFINVEKYMVELARGDVVVREKIVKGGRDGSAVIILPLTEDNNTLLVVQSRAFTKDTVCVELPAGYIEDGESPIAAGKRELEEETGYVPEKIELLGSYYQDQGCSAAYNYSMLALNCKKLKMQNLDQDEFIRYFECSFDEAKELVKRGYITDLQSQYTIEKANSYIYQKIKK